MTETSMTTPSKDGITSVHDELIQLTEKLLHSISSGDWKTYEQLCDVTLTAFEPEACGHLIEGMEFHRFYFDLKQPNTSHQTTLVQPHVRMLGEDVGVVAKRRAQLGQGLTEVGAGLLGDKYLFNSSAIN